MTDLALVGCGARKRPGRHAARDLYTGPLFTATYAHASRRHAVVRIVSARHGLVDPLAEVDSYDLAVTDLGAAERAAWARGVAAALFESFGPVARATIYAGRAYTDAIRVAATADGRMGGWAWEEPLAGLSQGARLAWLKRHRAPAESRIAAARVDAPSPQRTGRMRELNLLISFAEGAAKVEQLLGRAGWRVLVDSGAFANFNRGREVVSLDAYAGWLREHGGRCWRYFSLDAIADPDRSRANLDRLRASGLDPVPVFQRGGRAAELRQLLGENRLVGIGGVAAKLTGDRDYMRQVMDVARERRDRLHLLGCGVTRVFYDLRPYSADSSTYCSRHGFVRFWEPLAGRLSVLRFIGGAPHLDGRPAKLQRARLGRLCADYEIDPAEVHDRAFYAGYRARVANLRAFIRYQASLRRLGTEYFIAMSVGDINDALPEAWDLERDKTEDGDADVHALA